MLASLGYGDSIVLLLNSGITLVMFATPIVFAHFSPRRFSCRGTSRNAVGRGRVVACMDRRIFHTNHTTTRTRVAN